jgi:hypothetical protein
LVFRHELLDLNVLLRNMKTLTLAIFLFWMHVADAQDLKIAWEPHQVIAVVEVSDATNGIDATEARGLAEAYFTMTEGFDGGLWSMRLEERWWIFETIVGGNDVPGMPIRVHAEKGWITKKNGPIVRPPWTKVWMFYSALIDSKKKAEQDGADQPATAVESKAEGEEEPKPESEGRSQ